MLLRFDRLLNLSDEVGHWDRFLEVGVKPSLLAIRLSEIATDRSVGNEAKPARWIPFAELASDFKATHQRHIQIEKDQIEFLFAEQLERFISIAGEPTLTAETTKEGAGQFSLRIIVINNEDLEVCVRRGCHG